MLRMSSKYAYSRDPDLDIAPEGWFSDAESEHEKVPAVKKTKLTTRFNLATLKDLEKYSDKKPPKNTGNSTAWALKKHADWVEQQNSCFPADIVPEAMLTTGSAEQLHRWLSFYVLETRKRSF